MTVKERVACRAAGTVRPSQQKQAGARLKGNWQERIGHRASQEDTPGLRQQGGVS